jgi:fatty-acyl-CoA synthase
MSSNGKSEFDALPRNPANHVPLTPLTFLQRAAAVFPERVAVVHGATRRSWGETYTRCRRLASALSRAGVGSGDTVAIMGANTPEMLEAHFGVPMAGAVLNAINTRLDAATVASILDHGEAKVLLTDREFSRTVAAALQSLPGKAPLVIDIDDRTVEGGELLGTMDYEALLALGDPSFEWRRPADEWQAITLNYTSGTTGNPKGVVYHHRGAYLSAVSNVIMWELGAAPVLLWTLPMFHCNGWCFLWSMALVAGTSVCLRSVRAAPMFALLKSEQVTHLCGAPPVLSAIANAPEELRCGLGLAHRVRVLTGGAAPPPALIEHIERCGFEVTHGYGLTESFGAATLCTWQTHWSEAPPETRWQLKARQGAPVPLLDEMMVADPATLRPVLKDGQMLGEVFLRGNTIMKGYFKNRAATEECFAGGWFHTGDLAVWHRDGYIEVRDRSKDVIISGGENISSLEVESVLLGHPAVLEAAVVAMPDAQWGESPCAFVVLRDEAEVEERELISFCRQRLAHYKVPKSIVYGALPKSATGKVQKNLLRKRAAELALLF